MERKLTRTVAVGDRLIGGGNPILVQSMTNTDTADAAATIAQIRALEDLGCDLVRVSVYNEACARAVADIKKEIRIPLVADVHFDPELALAAVENGVDKLRINPGNIGRRADVQRVAAACADKGVPIRIGVNAGSLNQEQRDKWGVSAQGLVESALAHAAILEKEHFYDIVISVKASDAVMNVEAYRLLSQKCDYPLHIGVTEAGAGEAGLIKSAVGIGALLLDGIGDTLRVSLTGSPLPEVTAGIEILRSVGLYDKGLQIISCPTCGRTEIPLERIVEDVRQATKDVQAPLKVAIMGCVVNGPGEAREADIGLAGGKDCAVIFRKEMVLRKVASEEAAKALIEEIRKMTGENA